MKEFTIVLSPDTEKPSIFNVSVPALRGCFAYGKGEDKAITGAKNAILSYCGALKLRNKKIPADVAEVDLSHEDPGSFIRKVQVDI